jgi:hypothetical protein
MVALAVPSALADRRDFEVQVDAVEEWAADPAHVAVDLHRGAFASMPRVAEVAARVAHFSISCHSCSW